VWGGERAIRSGKEDRGGHHDRDQRVPARTRADITGIAELLVFHPVDTVAKRLMSNRGQVSAGSLNEIIFRKAAEASIGGKFLSLFPGLGYAAGYKIAQRVYKFGGQPYFRDMIDSNGGDWFRTTFGKKNGGMLMHAAAGS
jgi:hypothetical protein